MSLRKIFILCLIAGLVLSCKTDPEPMMVTGKPSSFKNDFVNRQIASNNGFDLIYDDIILIGNIPGEYFGRDKNRFHRGYVWIKKKKIHRIVPLRRGQTSKVTENPKEEIPGLGDNFIVLRLIRERMPDYDAIYPGLIDLHNHPRRNVLPVWNDARGQFANRFEFRNYLPYKLAGSSNINIWFQADPIMPCAAYRWNEMQALVLGTTYLQGFRECDRKFAIHKLIDTDQYNPSKSPVSSPFELIKPDDFIFLWKHLKPLMKERNWDYERALAYEVRKNCRGFRWVDETKVNSVSFVDQIKNLQKLKQACGVNRVEDEANLPDQLLIFLNRHHPNIVKRKNLLKDPKASAYIIHLAEGRRDDPYNQIEFEMIKLLGLDKPQMSFVHALGLSQDDYLHMINNKMGLIWSPYSNLLLYGQSLDLTKIHSAEKQANQQMMLALGSDWTPTGTKSVLEELKLARKYLKLMPNWNKWFSDERLYHMVTSAPAKIVNAQGKIGTLARGAMASILVTTTKDKNPYTNLVRDALAEDVNLVMVDGKAAYGNLSYIQAMGVFGHEKMPHYLGELNDLVNDQGEFKYPEIPRPPDRFGRNNDPEMKAYPERLGKWINANRDKFPQKENKCEFMEPKAFVTQYSKNSDVIDYYNMTGLNLDRFQDIQLLIALAAMTQSRNIHVNDGQRGKLSARLKAFPSLYSCNDPESWGRFTNFLSDGESDEYRENLPNANKLKVEAMRLCQLYKVCDHN